MLMYRKSLEEIYFLQCSTTFSIFSLKSFRMSLPLIKVQGKSQMGGFSFSVNGKTNILYHYGADGKVHTEN